MTETKVRQTKTRMTYWATLGCGCKLDRVEGVWPTNPYSIGDEYDCDLHGEVVITRTHGLSR
jgi:hypothetical protein